jgi:putative transcriptional regulator
MAKNTDLSPLAKGIKEGLEQAIVHAQGKPTPRTRETVVDSADVKAIRESLGMSQSEFASAYKIPLATLQNWEQRRRYPDATVSSYLWVIEKYPQEIKELHESRARYTMDQTFTVDEVYDED